MIADYMKNYKNQKMLTIAKIAFQFLIQWLLYEQVCCHFHIKTVAHHIQAYPAPFE